MVDIIRIEYLRFIDSFIAVGLLLPGQSIGLDSVGFVIEKHTVTHLQVVDSSSHQNSGFRHR
jgi:hypothetical protein